MIRNLRIIGNIEGVSYLILLFIAITLKYAYDMPMAVKITMAHGSFVAYCLLLAICMKSFHGNWALDLSFYRPSSRSAFVTDKTKTTLETNS